ncbi:hypothetical protein [Streptomyces sp. NPDC002088]|uniref:hypothetical protein n=1 Tax=Streptomyces sp. NPDC002088 TaxID=3154665 RepID=UPI0033164DEC
MARSAPIRCMPMYQHTKPTTVTTAACHSRAADFRYDRAPVGALQGLDPERVLYAGSVSKSLAPGLRLGGHRVIRGRRAPVPVTRGRIARQFP